MKRNKATRWLRKRKRAVKGGLAKLVARSAESSSENSTVELTAELQSSAQPNSNVGVLRQDNSQLRLPNALAEAGESENTGWMPSSLVLFVVGLAVIFIAVISWLISNMPANPV